MPYLPVYYDSLGHGGRIIGYLGAVKPLTTFLVAPLWGLLSDSRDSPFGILQVTFLVSYLGQLAVAWDPNYYFLLYTVFFTALFNAPVKSLLDTWVLGTLEDQSHYGRLRLWGQLGFGVCSSVVGLLLSRSPTVPWPQDSTLQVPSELPKVVGDIMVYLHKAWVSLTGYKLLFLVYAGLSIPTYVVLRLFRRVPRVQHVQRRKERASIGRGLQLVLRNTDARFFFGLVFLIGLSSGCIENFAYVRLREVGGTGQDMGLSRLVSSIAGAPMFWYASQVTKWLGGVDRVLVVSVVSYILRFLVYSSMRKPIHGLPAEALRGITFAGFWSSATIYAHQVAPPGLQSTMLLLLNAMYGGLGQSLGAILGGRLQEKFGTVQTFRIAGLVDAAIVLVIVLFMGKRDTFRNPKSIQE